MTDVPRRLLVRAPNHLGDLVMALPALQAVAPADVVIARPLASLLECSGAAARIYPLERGVAALLRTALALREGRYGAGILLTPSFSSALLFFVGGVKNRRGTATDGRGPLLTDRVDPCSLEGLHRSAQYVWLATGVPPNEQPVPRLAVAEAQQVRWLEVVGERPADPVVGIFPGSNASSRRWDPERFGAVAERLADEGARVIVFGGPGERQLTARVAGRAALDLGGRTDLPLLAAGLAACDLLISNDSGPLHLAAAVGTLTVALCGAGDPSETGPPPGHAVVRHAELSCVPCVRNQCPRTGQGQVLPEAERECLRLIEVEEVLQAARSCLQSRRTGIPRGEAPAGVGSVEGSH